MRVLLDLLIFRKIWFLDFFPNLLQHKIRMDKAAAALEAKSDQKGVQGKKPVVGNKEKKAVGDKKLKKPVVGKNAAGTKKPAAEPSGRSQSFFLFLMRPSRDIFIHAQSHMNSCTHEYSHKYKDCYNYEIVIIVFPLWQHIM